MTRLLLFTLLAATLLGVTGPAAAQPALPTGELIGNRTEPSISVDAEASTTAATSHSSAELRDAATRWARIAGTGGSAQKKWLQRIEAAIEQLTAELAKLPPVPVPAPATEAPVQVEAAEAQAPEADTIRSPAAVTLAKPVVVVEANPGQPDSAETSTAEDPVRSRGKATVDPMAAVLRRAAAIVREVADQLDAEADRVGAGDDGKEL